MVDEDKTIDLVGDWADTDAAKALDTLPTTLPGHEAANLCDEIARAIRSAFNQGRASRMNWYG